ncbi:MAG: hypothetical protein WCG26_16265, partial [Chloroflexales bacterium]
EYLDGIERLYGPAVRALMIAAGEEFDTLRQRQLMTGDIAQPVPVAAMPVVGWSGPFTVTLALPKDL